MQGGWEALSDNNSLPAYVQDPELQSANILAAAHPSHGGQVMQGHQV